MRRWVQFGSHSAVQHIAIYWLAPLLGALLAGAFWGAVNVPQRRPHIGPKGSRKPRVPVSKDFISSKVPALRTAAAGQIKKAN